MWPWPLPLALLYGRALTKDSVDSLATETDLMLVACKYNVVEFIDSTLPLARDYNVLRTVTCSRANKSTSKRGR